MEAQALCVSHLVQGMHALQPACMHPSNAAVNLPQLAGPHPSPS